MKDIKFSVLIPVYNVEKYLEQCIMSVLNQNYENIEIILVDDGSTDGSGAICDNFAEKDSRIKVIHKRNEGLISARRIAIQRATGDYFLFLDSDDYWGDGLLAGALKTIDKYSPDMIILNNANVYGKIEEDCPPLFKNETFFDESSKATLYQRALESKRLNTLWIKIVAKNIVDIDADYSKFYPFSHGEDLLQTTPLLLNAKRIVYLDKCYYKYRKNVGITSFIKPKIMKDITIFNDVVCREYEKTGLHLENSLNKRFCNYMNELSKLILYGYIDSKKECQEVCKYVFETEFYKRARKTTYHELPLTRRIIVLFAERGYFKLFSIMGIFLKVKRMLKI